MAKRKTLKRQRDNALKEIEQLKGQMIWLRTENAIRTSEYHNRVRKFAAQYDVSELAISQRVVDATTIVRKMLHSLVDEGYFDNCVAKNAEYDFSHRKIKNYIEIEVIQPQANYEAERFAQMWGNV
jgi:hypothetical protein